MASEGPGTVAPQAPRLAFTEPRVTDVVGSAVLAADDERLAERWSAPDLTDRDLGGIAITDCVLRAPTLTGTILRRARIVGSRLSDGFATSLRGAQSLWRNVVLERMRIGSAELFDADLISVHIVGGKLDDLNGRASRWTDVLVEDCIITTLDLASARLERVAFRDCRIGTLDLSGATCTDVDVRSTTFGRIDGLDGLRGVTIDPGQLIELAPILARHVGLLVAYPPQAPSDDTAGP
jgi:uncharacterized protein YjbI with pentapeptide repeats